MNNKQVAHLWANKSRESAKGSSFFFEGDTIYSYGYHFPIARRFQGAILFTNRDYSPSTSKHKSYVLLACSHLPVYFVENPKDDPSGKDVKAYQARIDALALRVARARAPQWLTEQLEKLIGEANNFAVRFGFKTKFELPKDFEAIKAKAKVISDKKRKETTKRKEREAREQAEAVQKWLSGEKISLPFSVQKVYLRARHNGQDVVIMETSKGATVPLTEAEKAFRFVMLKREIKECPNCHNKSVNTTCPKCVVPQKFIGWHRNGEQFPIGEFHLDAVNEQGVVAGCHRIGWDEIERFAKLQGWL